MTQSIDRIDFLTREVLNHLGDGWIKGVIVRQDINNLVIEARALRDQLSKEAMMRKELVKGLEGLERLFYAGYTIRPGDLNKLIKKATELDKK